MSVVIFLKMSVVIFLKMSAVIFAKMSAVIFATSSLPGILRIWRRRPVCPGTTVALRQIRRRDGPRSWNPASGASSVICEGVKKLMNGVPEVRAPRFATWLEAICADALA